MIESMIIIIMNIILVACIITCYSREREGERERERESDDKVYRYIYLDRIGTDLSQNRNPFSLIS